MTLSRGAEFVGLYPTTDTPAQYVDKLYLYANVTPGTQERVDAIAAFGGAVTAADPVRRGLALFRITQNAAFQARENESRLCANRIFRLPEKEIRMIRRTTTSMAINFWLNKLNQFNGDFLQAEMVKAFLSSPEYRARLDRE